MVFDDDPFDVMKNVLTAKNDHYHQGTNVGTEPSLFYGRYEPASGAYIMGQYFTTRLDNGRGNTIRIKNGAIAADSDGNIYLAGASASGLPMTFEPNGGYSGGAYLVVISSDFSERIYSTRLCGNGTHAVAVAENGDGSRSILWGGGVKVRGENALYTIDPLQSTGSGKWGGFFAFIADSDGEPGNNAPTADFSVRQVSGTTLEFDASPSSDLDGDALEYRWSFVENDARAEGKVVTHTYPSPLPSQYVMSLAVSDGRGGWAHKLLHFGPPVAGFEMTPRAGQVPLEVAFNSKHTTDPNDPVENLTYSWFMESGGPLTGQTTNYTFTSPGLYTPTLIASDNLAGVSEASEMILVAEDESKAWRFDFGKKDKEDKVVPGFINHGAEEYTAQRGYGFARINGNISEGDWNFQWNDLLTGDAVQFNKYADERFDGEFMVDVPNGTYTVLMHFMQKYDYGFEGVEAEGEKKIEKVYAKGSSTGKGQSQSNAFTVDVTDGQLNLVFRKTGSGYAIWFISGIQIIPGAYENATSVSSRPALNTPAVTVQPTLSRVQVYDLRGRVVLSESVSAGRSAAHVLKQLTKAHGMFLVQLHYSNNTSKCVPLHHIGALGVYNLR